MSKEIIKIAQRIIKDFNLAYPLDLYKFASNHVDIEETKRLPLYIDGLYHNKDSSPHIYLNESTYQPRKHFTLAHELGHHFIPWHPLAIYCSIEKKYQCSFFNLEKEADSFAGELLMPTEWMRDLTQNNTVEEVFNILIKNNISIAAACLNITNKTTAPIQIKLKTPYQYYEHCYKSTSAKSLAKNNKYKTTETCLQFGINQLTVYNYEIEPQENSCI